MGRKRSLPVSRCFQVFTCRLYYGYVINGDAVKSYSQNMRISIAVNICVLLGHFYVTLEIYKILEIKR